MGQTCLSSDPFEVALQYLVELLVMAEQLLPDGTGDVRAGQSSFVDVAGVELLGGVDEPGKDVQPIAGGDQGVGHGAGWPLASV